MNTNDLLNAALGELLKHAGVELLWGCPNHQDQHPSLSVNRQKASGSVARTERLETRGNWPPSSPS